ncbi:hypothetical protein GPA26_21990, partial [Aromatoleum petrolei]|nr:hypothetical protein [Aromatoleum petrolei]
MQHACGGLVSGKQVPWRAAPALAGVAGALLAGLGALAGAHFGVVGDWGVLGPV